MNMKNWLRIFSNIFRSETPSFLGREVVYNHPNTPPTIKQFLRHIHNIHNVYTRLSSFL